MAARKKPEDVPLTAAAQNRAHKAAMAVIQESLEILAAGGGPSIAADTITSAGIPIAGGRTMVEAQKFRVNWYGLDRKKLAKIARLVTERNWFVAPVHETNKALYGSGFTFATKEARDWVAKGEDAYPFRRIQDDLLEEFLVSKAVVAFWRTDLESGTSPMIEVPDCEDVDYEVIGGIPQITVKVRRNAKIPDSYKAKIGEKMWKCIKEGKPLVIIKGDSESGFDFEILKAGKSNAPIGAPAVTGIMDDLEYIEALRAGDWNGAWSRREIIRHTKKGIIPTSGPNAGSPRNSAKWAELQAITKAMKEILGKQDMATPVDHEISWLTFGKDFFSSEMGEAAVRRLIFWGGLAAVMMLKTDSQITGLAALLYDSTRAKVKFFREDYTAFLARIFNSPAFQKANPGMPRLDPVWSVNQLYSGAALNTLVTTASTYGIFSSQTIREMFGADDEQESARMLEAHENRKAYTPPFEPRQGLLQGLFPEDFPDNSALPTTGVPGSPGRPTSE